MSWLKLVVNVYIRRLDREVVSSYSFDAIATDSCPYGPRSQMVRVDITVLDVNDNTPRFQQNIYSADISLDAPVGSLVSTVSATDDDVGVNAQLTYSLAESNDNTYFQVCRLLRVYVYNSVTQYNSTIAALLASVYLAFSSLTLVA